MSAISSLLLEIDSWHFSLAAHNSHFCSEMVERLRDTQARNQRVVFPRASQFLRVLACFSRSIIQAERKDRLFLYPTISERKQRLLIVHQLQLFCWGLWITDGLCYYQVQSSSFPQGQSRKRHKHARKLEHWFAWTRGGPNRDASQMPRRTQPGCQTNSPECTQLVKKLLKSCLITLICITARAPRTQVHPSLEQSGWGRIFHFRISLLMFIFIGGNFLYKFQY